MRLSLPDDSTSAPGTSERIAYDTITKGFGDGYNGPLTVVIDGRGSSDARTAAQDAVAQLGKLSDVAAVRPAVFNRSGDVALISVVPKSSPTSAATVDLVSEIRDRGPALKDDTGAELMVTGTTALNIDASDKLSGALIPYLGVVVGLALILLLLVFRSILVPLKAGPRLPAQRARHARCGGRGVPVGLAGGPVRRRPDLADRERPADLHDRRGVRLAMDYEVFLVTRMREEYVHGAEPTEAVIAGFRHSARVVTAAAVIMISVFAGFLLDDVALIKSIGLGLAAAVLFDAFVVRMTLVPAIMTLLGRRAWALPGWLDRALPNVDVEGERLRHLLAETPDDGSTGPDKAPVSSGATGRS